MPHFSRVPGLKFSTRTSAVPISRRRSARPSSLRRSRATLRLLRPMLCHQRLSPRGPSRCRHFRIPSPLPGGSTFTTSAPKYASVAPVQPPATRPGPTSTTRRPARGGAGSPRGAGFAPAAPTAAAARLRCSARPAFEPVSRPKTSPQIQTPVSESASTSTPVSTPSPSNIRTTSSVATLPPAPGPANGQPPRPPTAASTRATPCCRATRMFATAWP
mmetsp:Transcript_49159/g.152594  ORF Transcript_49159/g.152594 Transcript_49159/m.152594 type:complete len:217 (-) Transcript_49159:806-1456(-)